LTILHGSGNLSLAAKNFVAVSEQLAKEHMWS